MDNALAVYLPFYSEKGKISEDATQNKNDEKFVGNIKLVAGKFGSGIELDGQSYVGIPWSDSIDVVDSNNFSRSSTLHQLCRQVAYQPLPKDHDSMS